MKHLSINQAEGNTVRHFRKIYFLRFICLFLSLLSGTGFLFAQSPLNLDFEQTKDDIPTGWGIYISDNPHNKIITDSTVSKDGKKALLMESDDNNNPEQDAIMAYYSIPGAVAGQTVSISLHVKAPDTKKMTGKIIFRILDNNGETTGYHIFEITPSADWKEYSTTLPFDEHDVKEFRILLSLAGEGRIWADAINVNIDGKDILHASRNTMLPAEADTSYRYSSRINHIPTDSFSVRSLVKLGMIWGFLKYHHPLVVSGQINWDAALFRMLPAWLSLKNDTEINVFLAHWVDSLGYRFPPGKVPERHHIKMLPEYGYLFEKDFLPLSLIKKLEQIKNCHRDSKSYYATVDGHVTLTHENPYNNTDYPDAGVRLLALFRYWNVILYYYPYRYLIREDWNKILAAYIPEFINTKNASEYANTCLSLVTKIEDGHARVNENNTRNNQNKKKIKLPVNVSYVEGAFVVRENFTINNEVILSSGSRIQSVNGITVDSIISRYATLRSASNRAALISYLIHQDSFLFKVDSGTVTIGIVDTNNTSKNIKITTSTKNISFQKVLPKKAVEILPDSIVYIYAGTFSNFDMEYLKSACAQTKGLIVDLRCYPAYYFIEDLCEWLKPDRSVFACMTIADTSMPGLFYFNPIKLVCGKENNTPYKGWVVILVNETTQSQAEFTAMALRTTPNAIIMGSQTAGADGEYVPVSLPGNLKTGFSGVGYYYPDKSETQKVGLKIDRVVTPTIKGVMAGEDEVYNAAIEFLKEKNGE